MRYLLLSIAAACLTAPAGAQAQDRRDDRYAGEHSEHAIRACREAVRQEAGNRFGAGEIEFRDARLDRDGNAVVGRMDIPRDNHEDRFRFTCSMDFDRDEVRSVRISPVGEGDDTGYRERSADSADRAMENCRNAVADRITSQGYGRVRFDSMNVDERDSRIVGSAHARRGDDRDYFNFACNVELRDGDLQSVNVRRR